MKKHIPTLVTYLLSLWIAKVFLLSLPYKFSGHPDTVHIFSTIGKWLSGFLGDTLGNFFTHYAAYMVGMFEFFSATFLLLPILFSILSMLHANLAVSSAQKHALSTIGGLMSSAVMLGAIFFHLASPLGVEVINHGKSDGGSLFFSAISVAVSGVVIYFLNRNSNEYA